MGQLVDSLGRLVDPRDLTCSGAGVGGPLLFSSKNIWRRNTVAPNGAIWGGGFFLPLWCHVVSRCHYGTIMAGCTIDRLKNRNGTTYHMVAKWHQMVPYGGWFLLTVPFSPYSSYFVGKRGAPLFIQCGQVKRVRPGCMHLPNK